MKFHVILFHFLFPRIKSSSNTPIGLGYTPGSYLIYKLNYQQSTAQKFLIHFEKNPEVTITPIKVNTV